MTRAETSTTVRGVSATPVKVLRFAVGQTFPTAKEVQVLPGRTYELRTNAEDVDNESGAVTYPECFVGDGGNAQQGLREEQGTPFCKLSPVRITPKNRQLLVSVEAACNVWVSVVDDGLHLVGDGQPCSGGCSCGCGGVGPLPEKKKPCGCARGA